MAIYLGDINTRARGLRTRLLRADALERLARAGSLLSLQRELSALGLVHADAPATPASLEQAVRRRAGGFFAILGRWCTEERSATLSVVLEDEDRRSIQAILRGAAHGAATETRIAGLVPTPQLTERALRVLASQPTLADVVHMLVFWNHPFGRPLIDSVSAPHPSLFEVEVELDRAFAKRALGRARRGGQHLLDYARQLVDIMNIWSALLYFAERDPSLADKTFIEGGGWLTRDRFEELFAAESLEELRGRLARELRETPLANLFDRPLESLAGIETALLRAQVAWQRQAVRVDPSSAAPLIGFALELRAESLDLRRIIWGAALQAPTALTQAELVTA